MARSTRPLPACLLGHPGWLSGPAQVSTDYGSSAVWPGDTTGLSALSPSDLVASWGSDDRDVSGNMAEIYAANVAVTLP